MGNESKGKKWWSEHGSTVFTIGAIIFNIASPIVSAIQQPKALRAIQEAEDKHYEDYIANSGPDDKKEYKPLTKWERFKAGWMYHIPTAVTTVGGVVCTCMAHNEDQKTIANISTAYSVLSSTSSLFEQKVIENVSPEKLNKIRADVAAEQVKNDPPKLDFATKQAQISGDNNAWFKDDFSKRYFKSDTVTLQTAKNEINELMLNEGYVCLNEWYIRIGLDPIELGWDVGWHATIPGELMNFHIEYCALDDGTPCGVLVFSPMPGPRNGTYK